MSERRPNVFAVSRDLWDHPVFKAEPFTEAQAWMWLISAAAWKRIRTRGNVGPVVLERGEFSFSIRFLAKKFIWDKDRAHRFILKLKKHDMIGDSERDSNQIYSISNYNKFQIVGAPKRDSDQDSERDTNATRPRHDRDKEETGETGEEDIIISTPPKSENVSRETKALTVIQTLPDWLPLDAWNGFLEMRRKIRKPPTDRAIKLLLRELEKLRQQGHDPTAVLDQSTANNWQGLFPIKDQGHGHSRNRTANKNDNFLAGMFAAATEDPGEGGSGEEAGDSGGFGETRLALPSR